MAENLSQIIRSLENIPDIDDWTLHHTQTESYQQFTNRMNPEYVRKVVDEKFSIHIFADQTQHGGRKVRGDATFSLTPSAILQNDIEEKLAGPIAMARLTSNPFYELPEKPADGYPDVESNDKSLTTTPKEVIKNLQEQIDTAISQEKGIVNSTSEIYATNSTIHICNSRGIDVSAEKTSLTLDMILIVGTTESRAEHHVLTKRCRVPSLGIKELIQNNTKFALDSLIAQTPKTYSGPVIVSGEALTDMFSPFIYHSSAKAKYQGLSLLEPGKPASKDGSASLSLATSKILPFGNETFPFDDDGIPANETLLIKDGCFQRYWADYRYAQYIDVPVTGAFGNTILAGGKDSIKAFQDSDKPVYEIVAFSWMNPDNLTGDFVAEIKLGYLLDKGSRIPVKGGSLSGNIFNAFGACQASQEMQFTGNYSGPLAIRFDGLRIAGQ